MQYRTTPGGYTEARGHCAGKFFQCRLRNSPSSYFTGHVVAGHSRVLESLECVNLAQPNPSSEGYDAAN